jgi:transcriptional antiterminator NusG
MEEPKPTIYGLRTTANREDQVMDFVSSNAAKKKLAVYSIIRAHGMRGYIFVEAGSRSDAEQAAFNVPYARGILPKDIGYKEIEHMLEQVKIEKNIQKNDVVEIISGPFKREQAKITRIDKTKEEVVVELLEAAVPIPITVKMDAVKVIRREAEPGEQKEEPEAVPLGKTEERTALKMPGAKKEGSEETKEEEKKEGAAEEKSAEKMAFKMPGAKKEAKKEKNNEDQDYDDEF